MMRRSLFCLVLVWGTTAALTPRGRAPEPEPCNIQLLAEREPAWQLVRANGFTFCVPGDWRADGKATKTGVAPHTWRTGGASITWYTGGSKAGRDASSSMRERREFKVTRGSPPPGAGLPPVIRRFTEEIDGHAAELWVSDLRGSFETGGVWSSPSPIQFMGQANSSALAGVQLDIYRSVRFPAE